MSLLYKLRKLVRTFSDGRQDPANGKWFARTVYIGTTTLDEIAKNVAYDCTITKADCKAVIEALIHEINNQLLNSYSVKLDGLGTFKVAVMSNGAVEASEFSASKNITGWRVKFMPAYTVDASGQRNTNLLANCKVRETPMYSLPNKTTGGETAGA